MNHINLAGIATNRSTTEMSNEIIDIFESVVEKNTAVELEAVRKVLFTGAGRAQLVSLIQDYLMDSVEEPSQYELGKAA